MDKCHHENCGKEKRIWLNSDKPYSDVELHPWCTHCGLIKNISDDQPKKIGYWINVLSLVEKNYNIKKVQKRLIAKELESNKDFNDFYGITGSSQKELFKNILKKYCKIGLKEIDSYFY